MGDAELAAQLEFLERVIFHLEVVAQHQLTALVAAIEVVVVHRVTDAVFVRVVGEELCDVALVFVFLIIWVGRGVLRERHDGVLGIGLLGSKFVAELQLAHSVGEVDVAAIHVAVRLLHHTIGLVVVKADAEQEAARTSVEVELVAMVNSRAQRIREPIGVHTAGYVAHVLLVEVVELDDVGCRQVIVGVLASHLLELQLFLGIHQVISTQVGYADVHRAVVAHAELSYLRFHSFHDYHAVGSLRTIDGGRGCILEQGHGGYAVDIEIVDGFE